MIGRKPSGAARRNCALFINFVPPAVIALLISFGGYIEPATVFAEGLEATAASRIAINEFMADNEITIEDPDEPGEFPDWIELYNMTGATANIGGMYLTDDLNDPTQFEIPPGVVIEAGGHIVFWADDDTEQGPLHTNFKLGKSGEEIGLFDIDGTTPLDTYIFGSQATDVSEGRIPDGEDNWVFFTSASPGETNLAPPSISPETGSYSGSVTVSLNTDIPGATIWYAFGGWDPKEYETFYNWEHDPDYCCWRFDPPGIVEYTGPFVLAETCSIIARAYCAGTWSQPEMATYLIDEESDLPVFVLMTQEPGGLWNPSAITPIPCLTEPDPCPECGIYHNPCGHGSEWQRPSELVFFPELDSAPAALISLLPGVRIHGGLTREYLKKSFRLYFSSEPFVYPLYSGSAVTSFKRLILSAQGMDSWPTPDCPATFIRNQMMLDIYREMGLASPYSCYARVFINGRDWGIFNAIERLDKYYLADHLGYEKGASGIKINEFMADNDNANVDEAGEHEDWIEIYNSTVDVVDVSGMYLTDDLSDFTKWRVPEGTEIPARGFLLVWADDDAGDGPLHANFKLSKSGEELGLFGTDGSTLIDSHVFGAQSVDMSEGRSPDGGNSWISYQHPTPQVSNTEWYLVKGKGWLWNPWEAQEGGSEALQAWKDMRKWWRAHDLSEPDNYSQLKEMINIENFTKWAIGIIYSNNSDWDANLRIARLREGHDLRWFWIPWDNDRSFRTRQGADPYINHAFRGLLDEEVHGCAVPLLYLMESGEWRAYFLQMLRDRMDDILSPVQLVSRLDYWESYLEAEMARNALAMTTFDPGWNYGVNHWKDELNLVRSYLINRPAGLKYGESGLVERFSGYDADSDTLNDYEEVFNYATDPLEWDTDHDSLGDYEELFSYPTNPTNWDTDGDGMSDGWEMAHYDPPDCDCPNPMSPDADNDPDADGFTNLEEFQLGTDPTGYAKLAISKREGDNDNNLYYYNGLSTGDWNYWDSYSRNPSPYCRDLWVIPDGDEIIDIATTKINGRDNLYVIKKEGTNDVNLYLYNSLTGSDWTYWNAIAKNPSAIARDLWVIPSGGEIIDMVPVDISIPLDEREELAVLKREKEGDINLYYYNALVEGDWSYWDAISRNPSPLARDLWIIPSGNDVVVMEAIDIDSGWEELAVIKRERADDLNLYYYYNLVPGDWTYWDVVSRNPSPLARDLWIIPAGNDVVDITAFDIDRNGLDDLLILKRDASDDMNLYCYSNLKEGDNNYWDAVSRNPSHISRDLWFIPSGNNAMSMTTILDNPRAAQQYESTLRINFQPETTICPPGCYSDYGGRFGIKGHLIYGWN